MHPGLGEYFRSQGGLDAMIYRQRYGIPPNTRYVIPEEPSSFQLAIDGALSVTGVNAVCYLGRGGTIVGRTGALVSGSAGSRLYQTGIRGIEGASDELLSAVVRKGRTIAFAKQGSQELRYLDKMRANANVGGETLTHILLRSNPRKIEVLEEFLHGTQFRIGVVQRLGVEGAECHVKDFMIRHQRLLKISPEDADVLRKMLGQ